MLNQILIELNKTLGDEYGLFKEFVPRVQEGTDIYNQYKNVGSLRIDGGSLQILPFNQGITASLVLQLDMAIDDAVEVSDVISEPLEKLSAATNGVIDSVVVNENGIPVTYRYRLNYGVPVTDGEIRYGDKYNYVRYEIPIEAVVSSQLFFGDELKFEILFEGRYVELDGITSHTISPNIQTNDMKFLDTFEVKSIATASDWGMQVIGFFKPTDTLQKYIYDALNDGIALTLDIRYSIDNGQTYKHKHVLLHDCVYPFTLSQFAIMTLNMSTATEV